MFWIKILTVGGAVGLFTWHFDVGCELTSSDLRQSVSVVAQIASTMLGFVLAALAILATITNSRLLRNMQKTGHYSHLLKRMFGVTTAFGALVVVALPCLFLATMPPQYPHVVIGLTSACFMGLADVCRKLWIVLNHLGSES